LDALRFRHGEFVVRGKLRCMQDNDPPSYRIAVYRAPGGYFGVAVGKSAEPPPKSRSTPSEASRAEV